MPDHDDPFRAARERDGVLVCPFQGEPVPMILRYREVRLAAKDWSTYSSDAPFRVPIPSEEAWRSVRQLPIETDPPDHTDYRKIVEPFFRRVAQPEFAERVRALVVSLVESALAGGPIEIVRSFALPLQSRALALLFNVPESEADEYISWGVNVFREGDGETKGKVLDRYIHRQLDRAEAQPGDDYFSALVRATFRGRKLSREEMAGFANLTFAGGRDTIIHVTSSIFARLGEQPDALAFLAADPARCVTAVEEFVRVVSPLTHIGRVCKRPADILGVPVPAGGRVSLCWASANRDAAVFDDPDALRLDRAPNPHVGFGSGTHACMGAPHARQLLRLLLETLCRRVSRIEILSAEPHQEVEHAYTRSVGHDTLLVRLFPARK